MTSKINLGVTLYSEFKASVESFLDFLHNLGIKYVEIGKDWIPSRRGIDEMIDLLEIYEMNATLHASGDYNLAELDEKKWKRNILGILGDLSVGYDLEVELAVLHCGWVSQSKNLEKGYARFANAYKTILNFAEDLNIKLGIENQCAEAPKNYIFQNHKDLNKLTEFIDLNDISFILDVGHIGRRKEPLDTIFPCIKDRLVEIHLHDYNELGQDHLPLGVGKLDLIYISKIIKETSPLVMIENKSIKDIRRSIDYVNEFLKK